MDPHFFVIIFRSRIQEGFPIADQIQQRSYYGEGIVLAVEMSLCAAPGIVFGAFHQSGANGVPLYVSGCCNKVRLVHGKRCKAFLPEMPSPSFPEIDSPGVSAMRLSERQTKALRGLGNSYQMDVIWHQTPCPDFNVRFLAPLTHQRKIDFIILMAEKGLLAAVSALGYMVRNPWNDDARDSSHEEFYL